MVIETEFKKVESLKWARLWVLEAFIFELLLQDTSGTLISHKATKMIAKRRRDDHLSKRHILPHHCVKWEKAESNPI